MHERIHFLRPINVERLEAVEEVVASLEAVAPHHAREVPLRVEDELVHLVLEVLLRQQLVACSQLARRLRLEHLLDKLNIVEEVVARLVGHLPLEVGVEESVARVCEGEPSRVGRVEILRLLQHQKVARRLRHFLVIDVHEAVGVEATRPEVGPLVPYCSVVVEGHSEVVANEVLAAHTKVHRVPVLELSLELIEDRRRDIGREVKIAAHENVIENLVVQLLRGHSARRGIVTTKVIRALEEGSDGVVGHVDRGITQRLNYPLVIPRKLSSEPKETRARPLLQPAKGLVELVEDLLRVRRKGVGVVHVISDPVLPLLVAILQVPLVRHSHHTLLARTALNELLRLEVDQSSTLINHVLLLLGFGDRDLLALVRPHKHLTEAETSVVSFLLRFVKILTVSRVLNLELLRPVLGAPVAAPGLLAVLGRDGDVDDIDDIERLVHLGCDTVSLLVVVGLALNVPEGNEIIRGVRRNRSDHSGTLAHRDRVERERVNRRVWRARGVERDAKKVGALAREEALGLAPGGGEVDILVALEREALGRAGGHDVDLTIGPLERAIVALRQHKAVGLAIHGLRAEGSRRQEDVLAFERSEGRRERRLHPELDQGVLLRSNALSLRTVVVSAGLTIER
mmetsp:Transcript_34883/g.80805  ORF Transcript_34883/g.80805 Transcript_34883/m.80805 type:complete len:627 (+) Transcript_34883:1067-2947(+)